MKNTKTNIKDLSLIPNIEGFQFIDVMKNGTLRWSKVMKDNNGLHRVANFEKMIGWYELRNNENYRCYICKDTGAVKVGENKYSNCHCVTDDRY